MITEESIFVAGGNRQNRGGRPRKPEPGGTVSTWLPASYHDRLIKMANDRSESVSSLVKSLLLTHLDGQTHDRKVPK